MAYACICHFFIVPCTRNGLNNQKPSWSYTIVGRFTYISEGIERIESASAPQKVLIDGQIYILRGDIVYTIDGREVK